MYTKSAIITIRLSHAESLKDKRSIKRSLIERIKKFNVAIAETDTQDNYKILTLGIAAVSGEYSHAIAQMDNVIRFIEKEFPDANVNEPTDGFSHGFFRNTSCRYFPCHDLDEGEYNCLLCYCPLYPFDCPGDFSFAEYEGKRLKLCHDCTYPHKREHYGKIMAMLTEEKLAGLFS